MAFISSFIQYAVEMIVLAAIAVAGALVGRNLRRRKDEKSATVRIGTGRK